MIRDLVAVTMICMHQVSDIFMGVAMFFDLGLMLRDDLCQFCEVMGSRARVRGRSTPTANAMIRSPLRYPMIAGVILPALVGLAHLFELSLVYAKNHVPTIKQLCLKQTLRGKRRTAVLSGDLN